MDDKIIYYLVIAAVYVLYNWMKRKKEPREIPADDEPPVGRAGQPSSKPRQPTFEELLREISEGKQPVPEPVTEYRRAAPTPYETTYERVDHEEYIQPEVTAQPEERAYDYTKESTYKQFEEAKKQAFYRKSLEETIRLEDVKMDFGRFREFERVEKRNLLAEYTQDLRDPEGFKKAVIVSEILARKHF